MEQKNSYIVRQIVGYHRYYIARELELFDRIWTLQPTLPDFQASTETDLQTVHGRRD